MKKNLLKFIPILSVVALFPAITFAQTCTGVGISKFICQLQQILTSIEPVLVSLGVVYFVWGVVRYVIADGEEAKKKGRDMMIYGIIGLAVIISLWGLVNILKETFFGSGAIPVPSSTSVAGGGSGCSALTSTSKFSDLLCYITSIINNSFIPLIFAAATVMFIWGAIKFFIINADEEAKREQGKQYMIWGIVALAVMLSVWGLVGILGSTFGIGTSILPQVNPPGSSSGYGTGPCPDGSVVRADGTCP